jgi:hypothetical protein
MNIAHGVFSQILRRKCTFHLTTFVLRSVWMNRYNSGQGCNLDELSNQSKLTHDLASAQGTRGHEKIFYDRDSVFEAWHSHVWAKRCYRSKISKGGFIKVTIGLTKPMRKGDTVRCLLVSQRNGKIYNMV